MRPSFFFISLCLLLFQQLCFAQAEDTRQRSEFLKINLLYEQISSDEFSFGKFRPAFVISTRRNYHELGLTNLSFGKSQVFAEYERAPTFSTGLIYSYRKNVLRRVGRWNPQAGCSFSFDYRSMHLTPKAPDRYKEIYTDVFSYRTFFNAALNYRVSDKAFIDIDVPILIWNAAYFYQKDILPVTREVRHLSSWQHPSGYFNLILGFRYRI